MSVRRNDIGAFLVTGLKTGLLFETAQGKLDHVDQPMLPDDDAVHLTSIDPTFDYTRRYTDKLSELLPVHHLYVRQQQHLTDDLFVHNVPSLRYIGKEHAC